METFVMPALLTLGNPAMLLTPHSFSFNLLLDHVLGVVGLLVTSPVRLRDVRVALVAVSGNADGGHSSEGVA
jgi:hypothetical protein